MSKIFKFQIFIRLCKQSKNCSIESGVLNLSHLRIFDVLDAKCRKITDVKASVFLYSIRVGLFIVYFADFVGLQLKESFQHLRVQREKIEIPDTVHRDQVKVKTNKSLKNMML